MNQVGSLCRCILCHDYGDSGDRHPMELTTIRHVQQHGWGVTTIPEDDKGPGWAYTIGLWHTHRMPELAIFGLDVELSQMSLNELGDRASDGVALEAEQARDDAIKGYQVHLKSIDYRWYKAFFGRAIAFYRRPPIPFLQVVWPDRQGRFHWDSDNDAQLHRRQPQLWNRPDDHPAGVWTQDL
ncbi:DUF4262 domain-containing protein [Micromonospora vinacea]|uniref:DUF4262 domain-containing protein n=1 Tax=Micromonospora vinacea TaxID=709878 RepID=A0ABS0JWV6_9ACTN|nr:DUF4262 domain-containing protein [Micromonospora vinacea]MBG6100835.1 hypothetical protein [Micromonospora vinacea]WSZ76265.1 DUF4262 domain-containing protein [Micromonospora sp. NBC_00860]